MSGRIRKALLIGASPKGMRGASWSLGCYVLDCLESQGIAARKRGLRPHETIREDVAWADLLILSFPLYADGVPSQLLRLMQRLAAERPGPKFLAAFCNCGFPESRQNETALRICRKFASEAGFAWLGGVGRGGGGMLSGQPLREAGGAFEKTRRALAEAAGALAKAEPIPDRVVLEAEAPLIPDWAYRSTATLAMLYGLLKNGRFSKRNDRPFDRLPDPFPGSL